MYSVGQTCKTQYDEAQIGGWPDWYNLLSQPHKLQRTEKGFLLKDLLTIYAAFTYANKWRTTYKDSTYYWFEKGLYPARAIGLATLAYFNIAQPGVVNPMNVWERYIDL